jgi:hypothetical protein
MQQTEQIPAAQIRDEASGDNSNRNLIAVRKTRAQCLVQAAQYVEKYHIEYSMHRCPKSLDKDLRQVFPDLIDSDMDKLLIIPTWQPSSMDLAGMGKEIEDEKNRLLDIFLKIGGFVVKHLKADGHWADLIDPCSGFPLNSRRGPQTYPEVEGSQTVLGYSLMPMGFCTMISHPKWKTSSYPATLFTTAPANLVEDVWRKLVTSDTHTGCACHSS